jgi:integrase
MYAWGMKAGLVPANPIVATFKPAEERPRDRVLSDQEIGCIWSCTDDGSHYSRIVRLLLLTGARRSEVAGMREGELVRHHGGSITWTIPGERTKNGLALELVLPAWMARNIPAKAANDTRDRLFGADGNGDGNHDFGSWGQRKTRLDRKLETVGHAMPPWVLHDLRRSFVTRLNDLGVEPHIIESLVNHVSGSAKAGIAGVYNLSSYREQKRQALVRWADHLCSLVETADCRAGGVIQPLTSTRVSQPTR